MHRAASRLAQVHNDTETAFVQRGLKDGSMDGSIQYVRLSFTWAFQNIRTALLLLSCIISFETYLFSESFVPCAGPFIHMVIFIAIELQERLATQAINKFNMHEILLEVLLL